MRPAAADHCRQQGRGAEPAGDRGLPRRHPLARAHRGVTRAMLRDRLLRAAGLAFAMVLVGAAAEAQPCPKGTLRIYTSWAGRGEMAAEGRGMKNGVDMAVAEAGDGVAGYCL